MREKIAIFFLSSSQNLTVLSVLSISKGGISSSCDSVHNRNHITIVREISKYYYAYCNFFFKQQVVISYYFNFFIQRFLLVIHFVHISVYMSIPISQFITPPPLPPSLSPLGVHTFLLYICVSISALQTSSSVPFFQVPHICVNIRYLFFSF